MVLRLIATRIVFIHNCINTRIPIPSSLITGRRIPHMSSIFPKSDELTLKTGTFAWSMHVMLSYISRFLLVPAYIIDQSACWIPLRLTGHNGYKVRSRHVAFKSAPHKSDGRWFFNFHAHHICEMNWGKSQAMSMELDRKRVVKTKSYL